MSGPASTPPGIGTWILEHGLPSGPVRDGLLGDLTELHAEKLLVKGRCVADAWFVAEACFAVARYAMERRRPGAGSVGYNGEGMKMRTWMRELVVTGRRLWRSPGFSVPAILTLGVGFGATLAVFGVVHHVLLRPLPYPDADRLVLIEHELPGLPWEGTDEPVFAGLWANYLHYRERSTQLEALGGWATFEASIADDAGAAQVVPHAWATPDLFDVLGARAAHGRLLRSTDPRPETEGIGTLLLTDAFWKERYGGAPSVVGQTIRMEGWDYEVVGVATAGVRPPGDDHVRLWAAATDEQLRTMPSGAPDRLVARLAPGATPAAAARELDGLLRELPERFPQRQVVRLVEDGRMRARVTPLKEALTGDLADSLWLLLLAASLLLVIALANVSSLVLVRAETHRREHATRAALGAGRGDVARHFVMEALVLVGAGSGLGLLLSSWAMRTLPSFAPAGLPIAASGGLAPATLAVAAAAGAGAVKVLAAGPLLRNRMGLLRALGDGGRGGTADRKRVTVRRGLVALQIALATVLLIGSGLLFRSLQAVHRVDPGFEVADALTFRVIFPTRELGPAQGAEGPATRFYLELADLVEALPGVRSVGVSQCIPMSASCALPGTVVRALDGSGGEEGGEPVVGLRRVSDGYLETLGVPLLHGRMPTRADLRDFAGAVVLNREAADRLWPGVDDPVGRRLDASPLSTTSQLPPLRVVGVVGDVTTDGLRADAPPIVYLPLVNRQQAGELRSAFFVVRTDVAPLTLADEVRELAGALRADVPVLEVRTLESVVAVSTRATRFTLAVLAIASLAALLLSVVGIYGVVSYVVGLRRSEFGIRLAMGAQGTHLGGLMMGEGLRTLLAGLGAGLLIALFGTRLLEAFLFGIRPTDPTTYVAVGALLAVVTLIGILVPAIRAARLDPVDALRMPVAALLLAIAPAAVQGQVDAGALADRDLRDPSARWIDVSGEPAREPDPVLGRSLQHGMGDGNGVHLQPTTVQAHHLREAGALRPAPRQRRALRGGGRLIIGGWLLWLKRAVRRTRRLE